MKTRTDSQVSISFDMHVLRINLIEFLTKYLEGNVSLITVLKISERLSLRDPQTLSPSLLFANRELSALKKRIDQGESIHQDVISNIINDVVLQLIDADS